MAIPVPFAPASRTGLESDDDGRDTDADTDEPAIPMSQAIVTPGMESSASPSASLGRAVGWGRARLRVVRFVVHASSVVGSIATNLGAAGPPHIGANTRLAQR